jgi:hypothetical protein
MFHRAVKEARAQAHSWKQMLDARFAVIFQSLSNMPPDSRSSTPSFFDQGILSQSKPLPTVPERDEGHIQLLPPLKHRRLLAGSVAPDPDRKPRRPLSWSETQINMLQKQVQNLRQDIIDHKRQAIEKDRIIATQQQHITKYVQRESKQDNLLKQFANNMHVALEDLRDKELWTAGSADEVSNDVIDDLITVYCGI